MVQIRLTRGGVQCYTNRTKIKGENFMKKRISLIVGLILCATIFTVYAAWVYAEATIDPLESASSISIDIETAETGNAKGSLSIANPLL